MEITIQIPTLFWHEFQNRLLENKPHNEEVIGFLICRRIRISRGNVRLVPRNYIIPTMEEYTYQSVTGLSLSQDFHVKLVNDVLSEGYDVIHIHSHPGLSKPQFSSVDDGEEEEYASFLRSYDRKAIFVSGVFNEDFTKSYFRSWDFDTLTPSYNVNFSIRNVNIKAGAALEKKPELLRQEVFGTQFGKKLEQIHVGMVGCGGLGTSFVDILARLGVIKWTFVDDDKIELSNLNRLSNMFLSDVGSNKSDAISRYVLRLWGRSSRVKVVAENVTSPAAKKWLAKCDLIVVGTDNDHSRLAVQEICSRFVIPFMSLATHVEKNENEPMRVYGRVTIPPQHGNSWSLVSEEVISAANAAVELADGQTREKLKAEGYITDVPAPAVYWANAHVASFAVGLIHRWILDDEVFSQGYDVILDLVSGENTIVDHASETACIFTARHGDGLYGLGDMKK